MVAIKKERYFAVWIILLLIELAYFYNLLHQVHDVEETVFITVVIAVTLVVGATVIIVSNNR
ncbi:hypothetical protein DVH26_29415 [Paenibacillus sp. H1-7]|uniref:hypothetical protein n=1 Tax=Paenibacillus sp. H1-7 TaxID=2282849 RepID=UPI001EF78386|nr:hypothetical protein [Paenibacillus sp. H1-7]ULL18222.1 hypothetical protein DVH26_29415 [Paenibacillus sp. H1-7]